MKFIRKFLEKQDKHFKEDGKLKRFYPMWEATESFFFTSPRSTKGLVHIKDGMDLKRIMVAVILALIPLMLISFYNVGLQTNLVLSKIKDVSEIVNNNWRLGLFQSLGFSFDPEGIFPNFILGLLYFIPIYVVSLAVGAIGEVAFSIIRKHPIHEGFFVTSMLFPLILPPNIPLWQVALGISFGVIIGKEVFGGVGMNVVNPALTGRIFLFFAYPAQISGNAVWTGVDGVTTATPLSAGFDALSQIPVSLNGVQLFSQSISLKKAFLGFLPGSIGETSALGCLIGAVILIITGVACWRIMVSILTGAFALLTLLNVIGGTAIFEPFLWHIVVGGFAFGTVFMATDPVTAPVLNKAKYIYGFLIGLLVIMVRELNPAFPEGMMMAILFANICAPLFDYIFISKNVKRRVKQNG